MNSYIILKNFLKNPIKMVLLAMGIGTSQIYLMQKMMILEEQFGASKSPNITEFLVFVNEADENLKEQIIDLEEKILISGRKSNLHYSIMTFYITFI